MTMMALSSILHISGGNSPCPYLMKQKAIITANRNHRLNVMFGLEADV